MLKYKMSRQQAVEEQWVSGLAEDIHSHLREREKKRLPVHGRSSILHLRPHILQFLNIVCKQKMYCASTKHLAAYFLDVFLDGNNLLEEDDWKLFVLGSLSVAVKLEESGDNIPSNSDLCELIDSKYRPKDIMCVELCMLEHFQWDILFPTASHFAEYYELYATVPMVDGLRMGKNSYELLKTSIHNHIEYFLDVILEDIKFYKYSPSMLAAACIASSRLRLRLIPVWPYKLCSITQYQYKDLQPFIKMLLSDRHNSLTKFKQEQRQGLKSLYQIAFLSKIEENISHQL